MPLAEFLDQSLVESGEALAAATYLLAQVEPAIDPTGQMLWPWPDVQMTPLDDIGALHCARALIDIEIARVAAERALA